MFINSYTNTHTYINKKQSGRKCTKIELWLSWHGGIMCYFYFLLQNTFLNHFLIKKHLARITPASKNFFN